MRTWQEETLQRLRDQLPTAVVQPYGSLTAPGALDAWSDLDVLVTGGDSFVVGHVLGAPLWAFQNGGDAQGQVVRIVLRDGRRVDFTIEGARAVLPEAAADNAVRFDAALAAVHLGRGRDLIGLHLTLGVLREALVQVVVAADHATGTRHHRRATVFDSRAAQVRELLQTPSSPDMALAAYRLYGKWRAEVDPDYQFDASGLEAVIRG